MSFIFYLLLFFDIIIATVLLPYFPIIVLILISFKYLYIQGLLRKGTHAIFQKMGRKRQKMLKRVKKGKIFEIFGKNLHKIWKYFEKGKVIVCDYQMQ